MYEIIINPEILLSVVILSLVLCGVNQSILKISVSVLIIVGILILGDLQSPGYNWGDL